MFTNEEKIHIGLRRPSQLTEEAPKPWHWPPRRKPPITLAEPILLNPGQVNQVRVTTSAEGLHVLIPK